MSLPPKEIPLGAMRFNSDSQKLEYWNGDVWMQVHTFSPNLDGGARGLFAGGNVSPTYTNFIDYITISSAGNATDFGDLNDTLYEGGATSSNTRGIIMLGYTNPANSDTIEYVTISSTGDAVDFGNTTQTARITCLFSNGTRGVMAGMYTNPGAKTNTINYVTIASTGNASDFGDTTFTGNYGAGNVASPTRGIRGGANTGSKVNNIDYITTATLGNAQDFGDLLNLNSNPG